ncbi:MAG: lipoyl(octanoyl) transferase LipB [Andreesenia angusta]|nr:lipoyl(octanoyl) transferase LipB [Andreesenia angusta]
MELKILYLGKKDYNECLKLQEDLFEKRQKNIIDDILILVEHNPVLTLGRSANRENIIADDKTLKDEDIEVVKIGRGGDVTYHGPGQLVGYPIINIRDKNLGVKDYVYNIEQVIIDTCKMYGIESYRDDINNGCWINNKKIAAVGFKVKKWVTMHGFAFNINTNLDHFKYIIPCGISDREATSLELETEKDYKIEDIQEDLVENFCRIFNYSVIKEVSEEEVI